MYRKSSSLKSLQGLKKGMNLRFYSHLNKNPQLVEASEEKLMKSVWDDPYIQHNYVMPMASRMGVDYARNQFVETLGKVRSDVRSRMTDLNESSPRREKKGTSKTLDSDFDFANSNRWQKEEYFSELGQSNHKLQRPEIKLSDLRNQIAIKLSQYICELMENHDYKFETPGCVAIDMLGRVMVFADNDDDYLGSYLDHWAYDFNDKGWAMGDKMAENMYTFYFYDHNVNLEFTKWDVEKVWDDCYDSLLEYIESEEEYSDYSEYDKQEMAGEMANNSYEDVLSNVLCDLRLVKGYNGIKKHALYAHSGNGYTIFEMIKNATDAIIRDYMKMGKKSGR